MCAEMGGRIRGWWWFMDKEFETRRRDAVGESYTMMSGIDRDEFARFPWRNSGIQIAVNLAFNET